MDYKKQILVLLIGSLIILLNINKSFANTQPACSQVGEIVCPKGYKPSCPKQYKPSCVFVTNKQLPACLADNAEGNPFYSYRLDKISCEKK